jgi:NADP-dependent aldehyde dehydrogenase
MLSSSIKENFKKGIEKISSTIGVEVLREQESIDAKVDAHVFSVDVNSFLNDPFLEDEVFGPSTILVMVNSHDELLLAAKKLSGHLTATIQGTENDLAENRELISILETKVGRIIINGYPTGVEVCHSMIHGGPFPATTSGQFTSVGTLAINRFVRPISYQNFNDTHLPDELKNANLLGIWRLIDGNWTKNSC